MRILIFYQYFTTPGGAWSTRVYEMARRWVDAGDHVTVVTSVYDKSDLRPTRLVERFDVDGIEVIVLNIRLSNKHGMLMRLYTFAAYALLASWYALRVPADVVVASSGPITVGIPGLVARYVGRRPFVFEVRDLLAEGLVQLGRLTNPLAIRLTRGFERRCYRAASVVVACSPGQAEGVREVVPDVATAVVSNACDLDLNDVAETRDRLPAWAAAPYVVYAGTMGLANDCWQLVRTAEVLLRQGRGDIQVVLIGDGADREAIRDYVERHQIENLRLLGLMPKREVITWIKNAHASMLSLRNIPVFDTVSPNKLFDSLAVGTPILQTTRGWIERLLREEQCGMSAPPDDPEAMAAAIIRLVDSPVLRETMGRQARRVAEEQFSRDLLADEMRHVLARVAGKPLAPSEPVEAACDI